MIINDSVFLMPITDMSLEGGCSQVGCLFVLFFTAIALYFDIVGVLAPSLSIPNKWSKFVNIHELSPPELYLLETLIFLFFYSSFLVQSSR